MGMGNNVEDFDDDDENEMTPMQQQMWEDVDIEMAKQNLTAADFPEGIDPGIFVDVNAYRD